MDDLFTDALRRWLTDQCPPDRVRAIEAGESHASLWESLEDSGFADALLPEERGGAGLSLQQVFPLLELCGAHALPLPLGETLLARAALAVARIEPPRGSVTLGEAVATADGGVRCDRASGGRVADWVLTCIDDSALLLPVREAQVRGAVFPLDAALTWSAATTCGAARFDAALDIRALLACVHAAQIAGALMNVCNRTLQYANDRVQFGRPIGKFQAIQHQLAVMAEHVIAARMAAQIGCRGDPTQLDRSRVAVAKARASEAALEVAAAAHAIHGAIGFTAEFDLQLYTRRLHAWRQAAGAESYWHDVLGAELLRQPDGPAFDLPRRLTEFH
ncbi:MAG: acyl-CoA/acyl-ACP dehydrogenase [Burkholderiales bacterium]|nr:acyl-CoA/acyl-ACP dehydrogenase [Burkholderiales bacterium]